jgi:hypothetical protein
MSLAGQQRGNIYTGPSVSVGVKSRRIIHKKKVTIAKHHSLHQLFFYISALLFRWAVGWK